MPKDETHIQEQQYCFAKCYFEAITIELMKYENTLKYSEKAALVLEKAPSLTVIDSENKSDE